MTQEPSSPPTAPGPHVSGAPGDPPLSGDRPMGNWGVGLLLLVVLAIISRHHFLLFHGLAELLSIAVAWGVFMLVWNTRRFVDNEALVLLGISYLYVGLMDLLHTLAYKGMGVFPDAYAADLATKLWIGGRYLETASLILFVGLLGKNVPIRWGMAGYGAIFALLLATIFWVPIFPACYVEGVGLTPFKITSEYLICFALAATAACFYGKRHFLDRRVYPPMFAAIVTTIAAELSFTFYVGVYDLSNIIGHFFKLISFLLVYDALIRSGLTQPYQVLFYNLKENERRFRSLVEEAPVSIMEFDGAGRVTYVNPFHLTAFGKGKKGAGFFLGRKIFELPGIVRAGAGPEVARVLEGDRVFLPRVFFPQFAGGGSGYQRIRAVPFLENDRVKGGILVREDISELHWKEYRYARMIEAIADGFWLTTPQGIILEANEEALRIIGREREEVSDLRIQDIDALATPASIQRRIDDVRRKGNDRFETQYWHKTGALIDVEVSVGFLPRDEERFLLFFRDITDRKRAEAKREQDRQLIQQQKRTLQTILDGIPDVITLLTPDFTIISCNKAGYELLGDTADAINGKRCYHLKGKEAVCENCTVIRAIETGKPATLERCDPLFQRWFHSNAIPIRNDAGEVTMVVEQLHDITERREREVALRRLALAIKQADEAILITDADGVIQFVNPSFEKVTGYTAEEAQGERPSILRSGKQGPAFYKEMWATLTAGQTWRGRMTNRRKDGRLFLEEGSISPVIDPETGQIVNYVAVKRDITAEIAMEERMAQAQRLEAIGTLSGGIAHDFNNILFPMIGMTELLQDDLPEDSPLIEYTQDILSAALRARDLVKQILAFSRQTEQERTPIRLQSVVKEAIKLFRASLPSNIQIVQQIEDDCPLVPADPTEIHQVVMNLVTNAFHAMEATGGTLSIFLETVPLCQQEAWEMALAQGTYVRLTVSDTGRGIDREIMDRIFDPYFTTKEPDRGTGLGLSVIHGIVQSAGGGIRVESPKGAGAKFQVFFPCEGEADAVASRVSEDPIPGGTERVLVVDDEVYIIEVVRRMLERLGYTVTTRTSSVEALALFQHAPDRFDIVISDLTMPNMTGERLSAELKRIRPDIPVILCTGFSQRLDEAKARNLGIDGYVLKPILKRDLAVLMRKVLEDGRF